MVSPALEPDGVPACLSSEMPAAAAIGVEVESVALASSSVEAGSPAGGLPKAVAVLSTEPESTSAWVSVYVAVHVVVAPGASVVTGQDDRADRRVVDADRVEGDVAGVGHHERVVDRVTRGVARSGVPACLSSAIAGTGRDRRVESVSVAVTSVPVGSVPVAVAVLSTTPASTSAWVSV